VDQTLTLIAALLAVVAAVINGRAALLGRSIKPELGRNLNDLMTIVGDASSDTAVLLGPLLDKFRSNSA
jgi:hypothetical protein